MKVAKMQIKPKNERVNCEIDIKAMMIATKCANEYNKKGPRKTIKYPSVLLFKLNEAWNGKKYILLEDRLTGDWIKYNNNGTFVNIKNKSQTAQAFTHFSYQSFRGKYLITDIQGIKTTFGYLFTDPAIHSKNDDIGDSDRGERGMNDFFKHHQCHKICVSLNLPRSALQKQMKIDETGTVFILKKFGK